MELFRNVERLWQANTIPYVSERTATSSKQDPLTFALLQKASTRVDVDGTLLHATLLFQRTPAVTLHAPKDVVLPSLKEGSTRIRVVRIHTARRSIKSGRLAIWQRYP